MYNKENASIWPALFWEPPILSNFWILVKIFHV